MITESEQCIALIKKFEGFKSASYLDSVNIATIGYGTTKYPNGSSVTLNDLPINEIQATEYLRWYVDICANKINNVIKINLLQCQFDAIVSLSYNIGISSFSNSTLLKVINKNPHDYLNIKAQFMRWIYAKGKIISGLVNRRTAEYELYASMSDN